MALPLRAGVGFALGAALVGCSLLAPGDDEYLGGSTSGGRAGANSGGTGAQPIGGGGGTAGAAAGGAAGASSGGTGATPSGGTGGANSGGTGAGGAGGTGAGGSGGTTGSGGTGGDACAPTVVKATPHPVALYIMLDHSSSVTSSGDWDTTVRPGVTAFVDAATSAGVEVGLQFWPLSSGTCSGIGYSVPAVSIAPLPGNATAIKNALLNPPSTGSADPMDGVINGGVSACKGLMNNAAGKQCKLVIISDWSGTNACTSTVSELATLLSNARTTEPSMTTFAYRLVLGASELTQLAQAGGTNGAYAGTASSLENQLNRAATPCHYDLPPNPNGAAVSWTLNGQPLSQVSNPSACSSANALQYYLTSDSMALCPGTCAAPGLSTSPTVNANIACSP